MSAASTILLVEDEEPIREGLRERLEREGYRVVAVGTRREALAALSSVPDLVILDRRLPDGEGLDVLAAVRSQGLRTAVVVVSARGMADDRVEGLEGGADDYVTKPFHVRELLARIRGVLARAGAGPTDAREIAFGSFRLDLGARVLRRGKKDLPLTRLEFELLRYLASNPGRAVSRAELLERLWGDDRFPTTRTIDFHVLSLRRKIEGPDAPPRHLLTVQGIGYRFEP